MSIRSQVILSQVNPPAQRSHVLVRQRVNALLMNSLAYPLTLLHAGTGFGKTTAVLSFIQQNPIQVFWYTVTPSEKDISRFLTYLASAFTQDGMRIGGEALRMLESGAAFQDVLVALLNGMARDIKGEALLVLDDFHHIREITGILEQVDWMIEHLPSRVHLLIATRRSVEFPSLNKWRARGSLLEIGDRDLSFTHQEISDLFATQYTLSLEPKQVEQLFERTEGWAIGLQMVWQSLRSSPERPFAGILRNEHEPRKALFAFLAEEVLDHIDSDQQQFLLKTSVLSVMDGESCDFLLDRTDSGEVLNSLFKAGLFVDELHPGVYRYHHLFHEFLETRLAASPGIVQTLHRKLASYFLANHFWERAIDHLVKAGDYHGLNQVLEQVGERLVGEGLHTSLLFWIDQVPQNMRLTFPFMQFLLGEVQRYTGHFEAALNHYHAAEDLYTQAGNRWGISKALRGQAQIYLDTIRPASAVQPLQDALALLDPVESRDDMAGLLILIAENQLNLGDPQEAETYLLRARELGADTGGEIDFVQARLLLRTGHIDEGIRLLEMKHTQEIDLKVIRPQRFHREAALLLSLFYAFKGDLEHSEYYARLGISVGEHLGSVFVQSVGMMRLGHPLSMDPVLSFLGDNYPRAIELYNEAIAKVNVARIHVEPLWGISRALGFSGHIAEAREQARFGLEIANNAGDEWIGLLIRLSLGAAELVAGNYSNAQTVLTEAEALAIKVRDPFSLCAARIWLALNAWQQGYNNSAMIYVKKCLPLVQEHHYEYLLTRITLLGFPHPAIVIPLLLEARRLDLHNTLLNSLLTDLKVVATEYHPGFSLSIQTLGGFKVLRGFQPIEKEDWKREKARQLLQVLVSNKDRWLNREQITAYLWPEADPETGANNFKVVLNTLNQVLEPQRTPGQQPFFITRRREQYGLNPNSDIQVDAELFLELVKKGSPADLEKALKLYRGHYFADEPMQEWLNAREQYLHDIFLKTAGMMAENYIQQELYEKALDLTRRVLDGDRLYEPAFLQQLRIQHALGDIGALRMAYSQFRNATREFFGSDVSSECKTLYTELSGETAK